MFEVTLVQKVKKLIVKAETPAEAVEQAMQEVKKDELKFEPSTWTVKQKEDEE